MVQASRLVSVCRACWRAASREVQRQQLHANRPLFGERNEVLQEDVIIPVPPPLPPAIQHNRVPEPDPRLLQQSIDELLITVYLLVVIDHNVYWCRH